MPIANLHDLIGTQLQIADPIIDHHEIVPGAVHFHETQHGRSLPQTDGKAKPVARSEFEFYL
jgi:hypothetical protein